METVAINTEAMSDEVASFYAEVGYGAAVGPDDEVFVAREAGEPVGVARLAREQGWLVLRGMQVAGRRQRRGVGRRLLGAVVAAVGDRECWCLPYDHLRDFYAAGGFAEVTPAAAPDFLAARLTSYRRRGVDVILMRRPAADA